MESDYVFIDTFTKEEVHGSKEDIGFDIKELEPLVEYKLYFFKGKPYLAEKMYDSLL